MFNRQSWAAAFINSLKSMGGDIEEGLNTLTALAASASSWAASMKGTALSSAQETALRFYLLLVKKKKVRYINLILEEIKNVRNKELGLITVFAEYAFPPEKGFETNYITNGKQVLHGGGKTGASLTEKDGEEYILANRWIIEGGVDFDSLRVLGKDMLADKNALYCDNQVIPFDKLEGFKFIIREL